jgi:hypothetical protein
VQLVLEALIVLVIAVLQLRTLHAAQALRPLALG